MTYYSGFAIPSSTTQPTCNLGGVYNGNQSGGGGTLSLISRQLLAAPAASVTFSSIPQTYENLVLEIIAACSDATAGIDLHAQFNGDTGANYDWAGSYASGAGGGQEGQVAATSMKIGYGVGTTAPANQAALTHIRINGYARTTFLKTAIAQADSVQGATTTTTFMESLMGNWRSTAAINRITFTDASGGNFIAGSVFSLYGES